MAWMFVCVTAQAETHPGNVIDVTSTHSFISWGTVDGVALGTRLVVERGTGVQSICIVDAVGPHQARCAAAVGTVGSTLRWASGAPEPAPEPPAPLLLRASVPRPASMPGWRPIVYRGAPRAKPGLRNLRAWVRLQFDIFGLNGLAPLDRQQERLDISVRGPLGGGFGATARATLLGWTRRTPPSRFRTHDSARLLVWEANAFYRDVRTPRALTLGRMLLGSAPGFGILDGGQAALWRMPGTGEVGVYGGAIPDIATLVPSADRLTAGMYATGSTTLAYRGHLHGAARFGWLALRGQPSRLELEALGVFAWASCLTAGLDVRVAWLFQRGMALEAVRADLGARWSRWGASLAWRYNTRLADEADGFAGYVGLNDVNAGDASLYWQPHPRLRVAALSSVRTSSVGSLHVLAGPQIQGLAWLPWGGDLEITGMWENGSASSIFLQGRWLGDAGRLLLRVSAFTDQFMGHRLRNVELGLYGRGDLRLLAWLSGYAAVLVRPQIVSLAGYVPGLSVVGSLGLLMEL